jgi:tRNA-splicing ligase RtcB
MKKFKKDDYKVPVYSWCDDIEDSAMKQVDNLARLPFAAKHIALMPDAHMGYGMPIGGVMGLKNIVSPNCVGVDIGCGVATVKTNIQEMSNDGLKSIFSEIRKLVPLGFKHHKEEQDRELMPPLDHLASKIGDCTNSIVFPQYDSARKQIGTLGGGNHFIEFQKDQDGYIWVMIHSGSRNIGHKVATHYNKLAVELNEKWFSQVPKEWQLAFFPLDSDEGQAYMSEMNYCVEFAYANRKLMMDIIMKITENKYSDMQFNPNTMINIAHNYAAIENHFGQNLVIHRKGATKAYKDQLGIIPGSQGTASYIVKGLGNEDSFKSCSHGAGRTMGRKEAQRKLDLIAEKKKLDDQGIVHAIRNKDDLDEASGAYKDIDMVMDQQKDLVEIVAKLQPIGVIKG